MDMKCVSKRTKTAMPILAVCAQLIVSSSAFAANHDGKGGDKQCSNRTLAGDYGTLIDGIILGPNLTLRTLTLVHYDGRGNFTGRDHVVRGGNPPPPDEEWRPSSGTYNVNPDCTGSATVDVAPGNPPLGYHFIVVKGGSEILLVVDGGAIKGIAHKVDEADED